jgi:hypothetical protein
MSFFFRRVDFASKQSFKFNKSYICIDKLPFSMSNENLLNIVKEYGDIVHYKIIKKYTAVYFSFIIILY